MDTSQQPPTVQLTYTIAGGTEHSGRYVADNILHDNPLDQSSRWSGAAQSSNVQQYLLLRLDSPAVLRSITFGKFHRIHPCNMKEFKIYVGLSEDNMTEVLHSGLKNDPAPETFYVRSVNQAGLAFPTRYIKIEPLSSAHGQSFHISIWYVALNGIVDERYVSEVGAKHEEFQETIVLRHVLKHLRQRRFLGPFQSVLDRSGLQLEHPLITDLHTSFVINGDYTGCEALLASVASAGLFTTSLLSEQPHALWTRLNAVDPDGDAPSARSGHAMCIDHENGQIYLFGGWDGQKNLDDFWVFNVQAEAWKIISYATQRDVNGPGPRSCHKMVFDTATGDIYVFGRLDEGTSGDIGEIPATSVHSSGFDAPVTSPVSPRQSPPGPLSSSRSSVWSSRGAQFYRYHTRGRDAGKWELFFRDTSAAGGPPLVFDHQMTIDSGAQVIYVSGGRVVDGDWDSLKFSGLYSYDIRKNKWKMCQPPEPSAAYPCLPSRFGHSMVFDQKMQTLFIFGGQREDKYLSDMYAYHIPSNTVTELFSNFSSAGGPDACFTQRAVLDADLREIYVFCGLTRNRSHTDIVLESDSPYWIYRYERPERPGKWTKILLAEGSSPMSPTITPLARYAHQVVYDPTTRTAYMHGGNACLEPTSEDGQPRLSSVRATAGSGNRVASEERIEDVGMGHSKDRLDDFWKMSLIRPSADDMVRRGRYLIRQQQFRELCEDSTPIKALSYLQTEVSAVVDHNDAEETKEFRALLAHLLSPAGTETPLTKKRLREEDSPTAPPKSFDDDEPMTDAHAISPPEPRSVVSMQEDPAEQKLDRACPASPERFRQRTGVFEQLMAFVNSDAKQPDKDLIRLINVDSADVY